MFKACPVNENRFEKTSVVPVTECKLKPSMRHLKVQGSNVLEHFDRLETILRTKRVVILLDYDGTCTPIVQDPSKAYMSQRMRDILVELSEVFTVGMVSGRSLAKLRNFVQVPNLLYAGSHGFDILTSKGETHQVASEFLPQLARLRDDLRERLSSIHGANVEDNVFSVTIHYRECDPQDVQRVRDIVDDARSEFPNIRFGSGKKVFELKPNIVWNKGCAMVWLLRALGLAEREDVYTIYLGDDVTDEDAFQVFWDQPNVVHGMGIVVTEEDKDTGASYSLRSPDEVTTFLSQMTELQRKINSTTVAKQ